MRMDVRNSVGLSSSVLLLLVSSLIRPSTSDSSLPTHDWKKEIVKKVQEVYRPLNLPGGQFLDKVGFHHTGAIVTTVKNEDILIHSYPGKAVEVTVMSLAEGPNHKSQWKPKTPVFDAKPGTTVQDAMRAATTGSGGSYRILHNNCNDVSFRVVDAIQSIPTDERSRRRKRRRKRSVGN